MPKGVKASQGSRKVTQAPRVLRVRTPRSLKTGRSKSKLTSEVSLVKIPLSSPPSCRTVEKHPLSEVKSNVAFDENIKTTEIPLFDLNVKNSKGSQRALSDSSIVGVSQGSKSGYSTTVLKVEAFDVLHKLLNVCCKTASLDVFDAFKILQQITPEIMDTVVQMLGENIRKSTFTLMKSEAREAESNVITEAKARDEIVVVDNNLGSCSSPEVIQPRQSNENSSSSSVFTAVDVLMSFTGEKIQTNDGKQFPESTTQPLLSTPKDTSVTSSARDALDQTGDISAELAGSDGVIDVTDSVFKTDTATATTVTTQVSPLIDTLACSEPGATLSQPWIQPFPYTMTKGVGNSSEKQIAQDDLNLLPNIQSILNPVSPLSAVSEITLNIPGGFSPLGCESAGMSVKTEHGQHPSLNSPATHITQKKSTLRTILPKPATVENTLRVSGTNLPIQPHRGVDHMTSPAASIPLATLIPTVTYSEQPSVSSGLAIKPVSLLTTNPLLLNQANLSNILSGHNYIFDPNLITVAGKSKDNQTISSPVCSLINISTMFDKSNVSSSMVFSQVQDKFNQGSLPLQQSNTQGTFVTYTEALKGKASPDSEHQVSKEVVGSNPQKMEKGSNLEAASALLSMGSRNKDSKNNSQVVSNFNRQRHTFDIEEQSLGQRGDILFTSTGTFQIEDIEIDPKKNKIEKDNYACGKCGRVFTSIIYLARHIKRVCPDMSHRKWKCDRCEKAFRHPFGLQQHIYTHTGERPYKCEQCSKAFYSANDLRRHKRTHSGERPYQCSHCSKAFSTTISLKTHTYIHTGERPHKCPVCGKTFATSSKLSRHVVTHSDQRPFACDLCPKTFNRSGDLRRHYNHVHQQEHGLMECDECNKVFATSKCLLHHKATHNRDRPQGKIETQVVERLDISLKEEQ